MAIDMSKVKVRKMKAEDLASIRHIDLELFGPDRSPSWQLEVEADWWVNRPSLNFIAEIDDTVVGFLLGDIKGAMVGTELTGWIDMMGVSPRYQGDGIGRKLFEAFHEECQENEVGVTVVIREDDERLKRFLTSMGLHRGSLISYER